MLNLIVADNFLLLFLGWEGVGFCSYLHIGFWHDRQFDKGTTADAAKKAGMVDRVESFEATIARLLSDKPKVKRRLAHAKNFLEI